MLTRPLSASSVRWLSGALLVKAVVRKEGRAGNKRMGSQGVSVGCGHQGGKVEKSTGLHGQWVRIMTPQGHGAVASWDNWSLEEDSLTSASAPSQAGLMEWQEVRGIV